MIRDEKSIPLTIDQQTMCLTRYLLLSYSKGSSLFIPFCRRSHSSRRWIAVWYHRLTTITGACWSCFQSRLTSGTAGTGGWIIVGGVIPTGSLKTFIAQNVTLLAHWSTKTSINRQKDVPTELIKDNWSFYWRLVEILYLNGLIWAMHRLIETKLYYFWEFFGLVMRLLYIIIKVGGWWGPTY